MLELGEEVLTGRGHLLKIGLLLGLLANVMFSTRALMVTLMQVHRAVEAARPGPSKNCSSCARDARPSCARARPPSLSSVDAAALYLRVANDIGEQRPTFFHST